MSKKAQQRREFRWAEEEQKAKHVLDVKERQQRPTSYFSSAHRSLLEYHLPSITLHNSRDFAEDTAWPVTADEYELLETIGKGATATVRRERERRRKRQNNKKLL